MKILQVCPKYYPSIGGIEEHVRNISERLSKEHQVALFVGGPGGKKYMGTTRYGSHASYGVRPLKFLFSYSKVALRQLLLTKLVLACVAAGYLNYNLRNLRPIRRYS